MSYKHSLMVLKLLSLVVLTIGSNAHACTVTPDYGFIDRGAVSTFGDLKIRVKESVVVDLKTSDRAVIVDMKAPGFERFGERVSSLEVKTYTICGKRYDIDLYVPTNFYQIRVLDAF